MNPDSLEQGVGQDLFVRMENVFDICDLDEFRLRVLDILMRQINAEKSSFLLLNGPDVIPNKQYAVSRGIDEKYLNLYRRYYHHLNPFAKRIDSKRPKSDMSDKAVLTTEDVIPYKRLLQTEYYNDFLKPQSIHHQLIIMLWSGGRFIGAASLYRPNRFSNFSMEDKKRASQLAPLIAVGLMKNLAVSKMDLQHHIIDAILSQQPNRGVIIMDESLTAVHYNQKAVNMFKKANIKSFNPSKPLDKLPKKVVDACKESLRGNPDTPTENAASPRFSIDWHHKCRMVAKVHNVCGDASRQFIILYLEPEESIDSLNSILSEMGLTPREVELSNLLVQGLKNCDISKKLFISEYTVQNHLKSIYRKMKVKNRSSLIYRCIQLTSEDTALIH